MSFKIVCYIKDQKHNLNNVGDMDNLEVPPTTFIGKQFLLGYICRNFRDVMDKPEDLKRAVVKKGRKVLYDISF